MLAALDRAMMNKAGRPTTRAMNPSAFGRWLKSARSARRLTVETVADRADSAPSVISNLERGQRNASREMVKRLVAALSLNEDENTARQLMNDGLQAAGFMPDSEIEYDEHESIAYLKGKPPALQDKALKVLKTMFDEDDDQDNAGNIGKKAE